ncbi:hypothetical protein Baya_15735 [Bagarius yarrelli]|uniref:Uncharacterized protein n=1 Tax=Bagarius yarrelli TaxID=175774 RepID=A0A556VCG5_BAGYA|nr:hypothetical protein Baya_15735 [Bagarius yarrelli]
MESLRLSMFLKSSTRYMKDFSPKAHVLRPGLTPPVPRRDEALLLRLEPDRDLTQTGAGFRLEWRRLDKKKRLTLTGRRNLAHCIKPTVGDQPKPTGIQQKADYFSRVNDVMLNCSSVSLIRKPEAPSLEQVLQEPDKHISSYHLHHNESRSSAVSCDTTQTCPETSPSPMKSSPESGKHPDSENNERSLTENLNKTHTMNQNSSRFHTKM